MESPHDALPFVRIVGTKASVQVQSYSDILEQRLALRDKTMYKSKLFVCDRESLRRNSLQTWLRLDPDWELKGSERNVLAPTCACRKSPSTQIKTKCA